MSRWRKKRDSYRQDGSPEDLADVNEQELAKDSVRRGAFEDSVVGEKRNAETAAAEQVNVNINDTKKNIKSGLPLKKDSDIVKASESSVSEKKKATEEIVKVTNDGKGKYDKSSTDAFFDFSDAEREENIEKVKKEKSDARGAFYRTVIALSLLTSILVFAFVIYGAYFAEGETVEPPVISDGEADNPQISEGDRVIYIRDLDEDSGVLSAAEIYSKNERSVVTVVADGELSSSVGTGFVLSSDGYIVTACHTVEGADSLTVVSQDGKRIDAEIVGKDSLTDIALLRVYTDGLVGVELGDSDKLLVGDRIIAIGTPYSEEFSGSVFSGSVSNCSRSVSVYGSDGEKLEKKMSFVQLSATLGKGCSGCPIFDEFGRVIGILSSRLGDGTNGVCFAIPINGASKVIDSLKADGEADRDAQDAVATPAPKLGALGEAYNENGIKGVLIKEFSSDTCDAAVKLKCGDIITEIEGSEISLPSDVSRAISKLGAKDSLTVTVYRAGQYLTFEVVLTE